MSIKPVLVPDHTANDLRRLMDSFAEASTGPTKRQLTESRAAVAAAQGVAEGAFDIFKKLPPSGSTVKIDGRPVKISYGSHGGEDNSHVNFSWNDTNGKEHYVEARVETIPNLRALAKRIKGEMDWVEQQNAAQGVAEGKKRSDRYHIVGKDGNPASLASYADQASAVKDRDEKHPGAEVRQVGPRGKITGVSEGIMDTVKQTFNDCVVGYPQGTSDEQFIQGWARAIQAETGRDIPLEKLTQLYQDYVERSDEIMQSHGTLDEGSAEDNLNELDKSTLGSYVKKAAADVNTKSRDAQQHKDMWAGNYPVRGAKKQARQNQADIDKRVGGISRAVDRLAAEDVAEGAGAMPVNKYIAQELDNLLKLAQDQVDDITNRSRGGYGNKKSGGLEDAIFELSGVSNGFHSSMAEGVAELQELNSGLPRIGNWIIRNLKKVGNRIDLPQLIKQETSNNQGVTETHDNDARAVLRNRIVADVLNFYSLNDRIPSIKEFSRPVRAKLNALEFDERSTVFRQAVVQALKLLGKQGMSAALTLDEHGDPWEDPNYDPRGGGETRSPEQIAKDNAEHAILSKKLGLKNTNKLPDIKDDMLKMMNHFMRQHSEKKDMDESAMNNVSVPAALEMLKDARAYLDQFDPEDDDDYFDAYETIAAEFDMESNDSSNDPLTDLLDMYEVNPQQAAQMLADHLQSQSKDVTEGWKSKLAAVAGAAALGGGVAGAQTTDKYDTAWGTSGYDTSIRSDKSLTRSMGSDPSKDVNDFQKRIQSVTGPNARGEYKVVVIQGNDIVSHYVTKTPPPGWLYKEDAESKTEEGMIDNIKNTVRAANYDRLSRRSNSQAVAGGGLAPPAQFKSLSAKGDQRAQKAQDIRKGDVDEGLKSKLAAAAIAGAAAFGGGGAQANDQIAKDTQAIGQAFRSGQMAPKQYAPGEISLSQIYSHPKWLETAQAMSKKYPKNHEDDQRAMNAAREAIKQMIQQGNVREGSAEQVDEKSEAVRHANNPHDHRSIYHVDESVDPIEQLRADIKRFAQ